jgi:hypothetical protein
MIRKLISVSGYNYVRLKQLGLAGDSFNDVLTQIFNTLKQHEVKMGLLHGESGLEARFTSAATSEPNHAKPGELGIAKR